MGLFSKKTNIIDEVSRIFLDQFPTWAVQHATKLVDELKTSEDESEKIWAHLLHKNQSAENILIDCLTGAHATYLNFSLPEGMRLLLGGEKKIASAILKWSKRSQKFFVVASALHKRILQNGEGSNLTASLEKIFGGDGKLEPLAVHIGTVTTKEIEDELNEDLGPFFVAGLYRVIFKLQAEQLDWISNEVLEKAKRHN
jgi:hypothetical protein